MSDHDTFEKVAGYIRTIASDLLSTYFGERCSDHCAECPICQRWDALDKLTKNPFLR